MSTFLHRFRSSLPSRGFTLTELMVVVAIMTFLTGVFLFQQRQFDSTTLLRSLTYSVALSVRQAQTYGVSVRSFEGSFAKAHGIHFIAGSSQYYLFSDINPLPDGDRSFDINTEIVEEFGLTGQNFSISRFCVHQISPDADLCSDENAISTLSIFFIRPNPDACFQTDEEPTACTNGAAPVYDRATIQLQGPGGATRSVNVTTTGQISVGAVGS